MNVSFDSTPSRFSLQSGRVLLIDPLALDGLSEELIELSGAPSFGQGEAIRSLGDRGLRIGLVEMDDFVPGTYELDQDSFEPADSADADPGIFEVDTGTVVIVDLTALQAVARELTWTRYDELLQAGPDDSSLLDALNASIGGPLFGIVPADVNASFTGDGAFRLTRGAPKRAQRWVAE